MSRHDCAKCFKPIVEGEEKEAWELLYHPRCISSSEPREFMVLITCGPHRVCWVMDDQPSLEAAKEHLEGIIQAGGNEWDTEDGHLPEEYEDVGYEVALAMDVTGLSFNERESLKVVAEVQAA